MSHRKQAVEKWYNFPPCLISVSALSCKTGNTEIRSFGFFLLNFFVMLCEQTHRTHQNYHLVVDRLSVVHKRSIAGTKQDKTGHRASSYLIRTQSSFTLSDMISGTMLIVGVNSFNMQNQ